MDFKKTILVIDDDLDLLEIYKLALIKADFNVVAKPDAETGLSWLGQILPDLIILDIMMPGISGLDMLAEIRANPNGQEVPVIIASAATSIAESDLDGYQVARFLRKPLYPRDLVQHVQEVLASA